MGDISNPGPSVSNVNQGANWNGSANGNFTTVGSAGALSESYYGTSDQGGNAWEWNDTVTSVNPVRGDRGGSFKVNAIYSQASNRNQSVEPHHIAFDQGFRVATILPFVTGDINWDNVVDGADYTVWADHFLSTVQNWTTGDLTGDGRVDGVDYVLWADHFAPGPLFSVSPVPEPSTLALAGIGAIALFARGVLRRSQSSN